MSSINLSKGQNINLTKDAAGVTLFNLCLGWKEANGAKKHDLDASVFMLNSSGKLVNTLSLVFYNNLVDPTGAVSHSGDNRVGGSADAEIITIDTTKISSEVDRMIIVTSIHEETEPPTVNFGQVQGSYIRVVNAADSTEIAKADLNEDYSGARAVSFGTLYRNGGDWKFKSEGETDAKGLQGFVEKYQ